MTARAYVNRQAMALSPQKVIGQGGEAVVYQLDSATVLKLYLQPDDPVFAGDPQAQAAARLRLDEQQQKLPAFPSGLPAAVTAPAALVYDKPGSGRITGYTMRYLHGLEVLMSYGDRRYRDQNGIDGNTVIGIFRGLHQLVADIHRAGVVIGDFNDLNVLVSNHMDPFLVDTDSMQFAGFPCRTYTARFVDPLHCAVDKLQLVRPHDELTDWYAYGTMLFQSLLLLSPYYGGVHRPKTGKALRGDARVLNRLSVMSPDVVYPRSAVPFSSLPDELQEYYARLYQQDDRGTFPVQLFDNLRWTTCVSCGLQHARNICPTCAAPGAVRRVLTRRGTVTATRLFQTGGRIVFATHQGGGLRYIYHEGDTYKRETGTVIMRGAFDGGLRLRLSGDTTLVAKGPRLIALGPDGPVQTNDVDMVGKLPVFDTNSRHRYWIHQGRLLREGRFEPAVIGSVLPGQTLLWSGERFGFGFYRAGSLVRGFVFDADKHGINDAVPLPPLRGTLIDATCTFAADVAWFMLSIQDAGVIRRHCYVITDKADILASTTATQGDGSWLGGGIRGHLAIGRQLYAATDDGIVRISAADGLPIDSTFPDTEPFVTADTQLLPAKAGLYAVGTRTITLLEIR